MKTFKGIKAKLSNFYKNLTFKKKQLTLASLLIFLNCVSWKKINAAPFVDFPEIKIDKNSVAREKKKFQGAVGKNLDYWGLSTNNFFSTFETFHKHSSEYTSKSTPWGFKKSIKPFSSSISFFPDLIEKTNEAEKLRKRKNRLNFGGMVLSGLKIYDSKYSFFSKLFLKSKISGALESLELGTMLNPDIQSFSSCLSLYPEIKSFHGLENLINEDPGKGFVLGKISSDSGSDFSREILIQQKIFGFHTLKNLRDAFNYQKKLSSGFLRKETDCVTRNKSEDFGKWIFFSEKKRSRISLLDLSYEKIKISKVKKNKILMFSQDKSLKFERDDSSFQANQINEFKKKNKIFSKESLKIKKPRSFLNFDLVEELKQKKQRTRPNLHERIKFGKFENKTTILTPSLENHIGFCKEFSLTEPQSNLNWILKNRKIPFHFHNLDKTFKRFLVPKKIKKGNFLALSNPEEYDSDILFLKKLKQKETSKIQKGFYDEILKSKKILLWEEEKKEDSDISHLKESLDLSDHLGAEFLSKVYWDGLNVPKSSVESNKFSLRASVLGNLDARYNFGISLLEGKGIMRNKAISRKIIASAAKLGHMDSIYDFSILMEKGLGGKIDVIRAFHLNKQITEFGGEEKTVSRKIAKKERVGLSQVFFTSMKNPSETGLLRCFVGSLFFTSMSFLSASILEKGNKISSALNYQNKTVSENCFNSVLSIIELFLENRQTFLSIEKSRFSSGFFSKMKTLNGSFSIQGFPKSMDTLIKLRSLNEIYFHQTILVFSLYRIILLGIFRIRIFFSRLNRMFAEIFIGKRTDNGTVKILTKIYFLLRVFSFFTSEN